jgi:hypothetical protein
MSEAFNKVLDTPFREAAFINEAFRHGYRDTAAIKRLLDSPEGSAEYATLIEVSRRANRNIIDFARLGPNEKKFIRRVIFFYPWFKGATIYGAHFASEHPAQFLAMGQLGQYGVDHDPLEGAPSYMRGFIGAGEGNVPGVDKTIRVINPTAASVLGTPGEVINAGLNVLGAETGAADEPSEWLTPAISALMAGATGTDPFTGQDYAPEKGFLEIVGEELGQTAAPLRAIRNVQRAREIKSGKRNPDDLLYVRSENEAWAQFGLGLTPISVNAATMRSRGAAETRELQSKRQRTELNFADKTDQWKKEAQRLGLEVPEAVEEAMKLRQEREGELAAAREALGRDMTQIDRLKAEVGLLVRKGQLDEREARQLLLTYAVLDDNSISRIRSQLGDAYFGSRALSSFSAALRARGGEPERF